MPDHGLSQAGRELIGHDGALKRWEAVLTSDLVYGDVFVVTGCGFFNRMSGILLSVAGGPTEPLLLIQLAGIDALGKHAVFTHYFNTEEVSLMVPFVTNTSCGLQPSYSKHISRYSSLNLIAPGGLRSNGGFR